MNSISFVVRELNFDESHYAAEVEKQCLNTSWSEIAIKEGRNNPAFKYLVAKENQSLIGICSFYIVCGEAQLINIAVLPNHRRKGIGGLLLETAIDIANKNNAKQFSLEVEKLDFKAISFYERYGFFVVGERKNFYGKEKDAVNMIKMLEK